MAGKVTKNTAIGAGIIGFILIVCGLGCAVAGFVWTAYGGGAHGIWSGIFMIAVGVFGVVILITKSRGIMVVFLVLCIIDIFINIIQAIVAAIILALVGLMKDALDDDKCTVYGGTCHCIISRDTSSFALDNCDDINAMMACLRAVTAFCVLGIIATFAGSIIGCIGACCDKGGDQPGVIVIQQGQQPQVQTTTVQTFQQAQAPPPNQPYPNQPYPNQQHPNPNDPEMGAHNAGY